MGETLYNGIVLPDLWPPASVILTTAPGGTGAIDRRVITPPYLTSPPNPILIGTDRQLFVDEFLIESTTCTRRWHGPRAHPGNPVLLPSQDFEASDVDTYAMPFSGGVWWDPRAGHWKCYYYGGPNNFCVAFSNDGIRWTKPRLDLFGPNNIVHSFANQYHGHDSDTVWYDPADPDHSRRWKWAATVLDEGASFWHQELRVSHDGLRWSTNPVAESGQILDRTTFFKDRRGKWVWSIRDFQNTTPLTRYRRIWLQDTWGVGFWPALNNPENARAKPLLWDRTDILERVRHDLATPARDIDNGGTPLVVDTPSLYNLDGCAYESLTIFGRSQLDGNAPGYLGQPKFNYVKLGFSRDGFHYTHGYNREPVVPLSRVAQSWNYGNVQTIAPVVQVAPDGRVRMYVSGRSGVAGVSRESGVCSMGMFDWRRDGFCSMEFPSSGGELVTRPLQGDASSNVLYVNADVGRSLRVEVQDSTGRPLSSMTLADSEPMRGDSTATRMGWTARRLARPRMPATAFKLRFVGESAQLYSFWTTREGTATAA